MIATALLNLASDMTVRIKMEERSDLPFLGKAQRKSSLGAHRTRNQFFAYVLRQNSILRTTTDRFETPVNV